MNIVETCHWLCESFLPVVAMIACCMAIIFGAITMFIKFGDSNMVSKSAYEIPLFITRIFLYIAAAAVALLLFIALVMGMYERGIEHDMCG